MKNSTRQILEKADLAVSSLISNGGYLNPIQANTFIRMLIDQPTILNEVRVVPMNGPRMEINKIGFSSRILKAAPDSGSALAAADRSAPATDKVELLTKEIIAEVHIPYDVLEDNIERGSLEDTIMELIVSRAATDIEELIISGDTGSGDAYLALMDGVLAQATSHVVDWTATAPTISKAIFKAAAKAMPNKYLRRRTEFRHYVSPDAEFEWIDSLADRLTTLGDSNVTAYMAPPAFGIPVRAAALMPNEQSILTHPKNIIWGVQRDIMIETDRDIRARTLVVVLTLRADLKFEEEDAVVKTIGLDPNNLTTTT